MIRTKYDGKLTDSLIQTVIDAENRLRGLISGDGGTESPNGQESPTGQPDAKATDYSAAFDQSRHAHSIEESRERWAGCYDVPSEE